MSEVLISAEDVSKKFCKSLRQSMLYGLKDILQSVTTTPPENALLRQHEFWALKDVSLSLRKGECLGLIGTNGSGKSTLLKLLNGVISPDTGRVSISGKVGALVEVGSGFHPMLTGRENIYINGAILGFSKSEIDRKFDAIVDFAEIGTFIDTPVKHYSSGMYVRLGFAIAAQMNPDVLLIDEILAVGDVGFRAKCYGFLGERRMDSAIILVSHSMVDIARLCSSVLFLENGTARYMGHDVSEGIDRYYASYKRPQGLTIKTEEAEFLDIRVAAPERNGLHTISHDEGLTVQITARIDPAITAPLFHIAVLDQGLQNVCQSSSDYSNTAIRNRAGIVTMRANIDALPLKPGVYYLDFAVTDARKVKILARTHLCHHFQVTGTIAGYGVFLKRAAWEQLD